MLRLYLYCWMMVLAAIPASGQTAQAQGLDLLPSATGRWVGGFYILPTDGENERRFDDGGGITIGADWTRFNIGETYVGPSLFCDIFGQSFNDDVQLNQAGNIIDGQRIGHDVIGVNLRPGLTARKAVDDTSNVFVEGQVLVKYQSAGTELVAFDPTKPQLPVTGFKHQDWDAGWSVGGGIEYLTPGGVIIRPGVSVLGSSSNMFGFAVLSDIEVFFYVQLGRTERINSMAPPRIPLSNE